MSDEKIVVLAKFWAKKAIIERVKTVLSALVEPTRKEDGCIGYELHQDTKDPSAFMFYEIWASQKALDTHIARPHLQDLLARQNELFEKPLDVTIWKKLS
jgi:quinol monooxygenase YgiN